MVEQSKNIRLDIIALQDKNDETKTYKYILETDYHTDQFRCEINPIENPLSSELVKYTTYDSNKLKAIESAISYILSTHGEDYKIITKFEFPLHNYT